MTALLANSALLHILWHGLGDVLIVVSVVGLAATLFEFFVWRPKRRRRNKKA